MSTTNKKILVCFPWAGGSSTLYAPWLKHPAITSAFHSTICIDYPGRASRSNEEPIGHVSALVDNILDRYDCFDDTTEKEAEIVLFGHSFGAIVAFEVARRLEEEDGGRRAAKAVFVSACAPPNKCPLVETEVSKLSTDEICEYFASKGNPVSSVVRETTEFLDMFIRNVKVDYTCLETYPQTHAKLTKTPIIVIGGELDLGVSLNDLEGWKKHAMGYTGDESEKTKLISRRRTTTQSNYTQSMTLRQSLTSSLLVDPFHHSRSKQSEDNIDLDIELGVDGGVGDTSTIGAAKKRTRRSTIEKLTASITAPFRSSIQGGDNGAADVKDGDLLLDIDIDETFKHDNTNTKAEEESTNHMSRGRSSSGLDCEEEALGAGRETKVGVVRVNCDVAPKSRRRRTTMDKLTASITAPFRSSITQGDNESKVDASIGGKGSKRDSQQQRRRTMEDLVASITSPFRDHTDVEKKKDDEDAKTAHDVVTMKVYPDQGHFYLNDEQTLADLGDFIVRTVNTLSKSKEEVENEAEIKKHIEAAFKKALGISAEIPPDEHFFNELGGTSLDTMVLTAHLQAAVGIRVTQDVFLLHPTLNTLSGKMMELKKEATNAPTMDPIESKEGGQEWFPASAGQEQMVALWETAPTMYNMPTTIEFHGNLQVDTLKRGMEHVVKQQGGLRTITKFDMETNQVMQKVLPEELAHECLEFVEVEAKDDEDARLTIERESGFVFDLTKPPVIRAVVVKMPNTSLLLLNQHHVCSDGWSRTVQRRQYLKAYLALKHGMEADTIPKHPSFLDWSMYTRRLLYDHNQKDKQLEYWKKKLEDLPVLDLPLDKMRPLVLSSHGARIPVHIPAQFVEPFSELMAEANSNLFVGLISLYMSLLHVWGGGDKFSIGIAQANRQHEGLDQLVGYFANETAIVADFQGEPSFVTFLSRIRTNVLEAMANSDVPFHEVCEALKVTRSSSRTSVFQAMFALQEREWHSVDDLSPKKGEDDVTFNLKQYNHNTSKFEVHLQLRFDGKGGLEGDFHIATDLFTVETGERLVEAYKYLMQACVVAPNSPIAGHDILPQADRAIIDKCNYTSTTFGRTSLWELIEGIHGDSTAFRIHGDIMKNISYEEFRDNAKNIARFLMKGQYSRRASAEIDYSGSSGDPDPITQTQTRRIGILVRNSSEGISMVVGTYLAASTAIIVDIDKTPLERINLIFRDANVYTVLVIDKDEEIVKLLDSAFSVYAWREVIEEDKLLEEGNPVCINAPSNEDHPFAIYYTSGTTGLPKGVVIELGNVMNLRNWWVDYFDLQEDDKGMLFSSLSFIMSVRQWLPPLTKGASVTVPKSAFEFEDAIVQTQVNKLVCTPSALAALDIDRIEHLHAIQIAGEAPSFATMDMWKQKVNQLHIGLGPTELCAHALCGLFDGETLSIGNPAANVRAYVVNRFGQHCPINCVGELWVAGKNVANGYLNRPTENSKHFSSDPFVENGSRLYKTGDLCRRLTDGRIQFIGRKDSQIKLNGYRIEVGDIQRALGPEVHNSHILIEKGQLIAFVMPEVNVSKLKTSLQDKLPTYMIPTQIISVQEFPLNKNRKIDAAALMTQLCDQMKADMSTFVRDGALVAESHVGKVIKTVWSEVLGIPLEELKRSDNFFSVGGTSLTAVMLSRKLGIELCVDVSVQDVFQYQTIEDFTDHIEAQSDSSAVHGMPDPLLFINGGRHPMNYYIFALLQILGLVIMTILVAVPLLATTFISIRAILWFGAPGIFLFPLFVSAGCLAHMIMVLITKYAIIGRFRPGKARVFSWYFLKWWLVRRVIHVSSLYVWIFDETPLSSLWLKLLGAKIGRHTSFEQPFILEPDLVNIGSNCLLEFETQLSTSEIKNGFLEFRQVVVGDNVKLGVRSVLLGGSAVANNCEVLPKSALDFYTTTSINQIIGGSPATVIGEHSGNGVWRRPRGKIFLCLQLIGILGILILMAVIAYVGVTIGILFQQRFGAIGLIAYLGAIFSTLASVMFLLIVALVYRILLPNLKPMKVYSSKWFLLRKWFMDRLFLSPMFRYASERTLQTSSTFPWYLRLLGAKLGSKAWMNHPCFRTGIQFIEVGSEIHMGMLNYMTTERVDEEGVSFYPISIDDHVSFGQRCVALSGVYVGKSSTIGAETFLPHDYELLGGGTTFGSPPVQFHSSMAHEDRVQQLQTASARLSESKAVTIDYLDESKSKKKTISRRQDVGKEMFWTYIIVMLVLQALIPLAIGASYALLYWAATLLFKEISFQHVLLVSPVIYILGSFVLMVVLKFMQMIGGGFSVGTSNFFSVKFLYWHLLADMIYFCTSTVLYPLSGTQIYCIWLRFMGAKIGKNVFISPENGGFREIDFMNIGDDCVLMTPNIHAHYTDHGQLQFCSVILEDRVEINFGSTIMPLTQYQKGSRLRPYAVTVKGQICEEGNEYFGNPCKADMSVKMFEYAALLFPGQGSQYPFMLDKVKHLPSVQKLLDTANEVLGYDVLVKSSTDASELNDTIYAQPLVMIAGLAHAELMKAKQPTIFTKVKAVAGFSLGEITALCYAGAFSLEDALKLVKNRSEAMAKCNGGAMCNVIGLSLQGVRSLCKKTGCTVANIICNHKRDNLVKFNIFVCAGSDDKISSLVKSVEAIVVKDGRTKPKSKKLRVSGAFHSKDMSSARAQLNKVLDEISITLPTDKLVYSNVTGRPYKSVKEIRRNLSRHIVKPVLWHDTIESLCNEEKVTIFVECGPQKVLTKIQQAYLKCQQSDEESQQHASVLTSDS